jgi:methionyl aminopeptidase
MRDFGGFFGRREAKAPPAAPVLKSPREIELIRAAGRVVHQVLERLRAEVRPGVTTGELGEMADASIRAAGAQALFRGVRNPSAKFPFPAAICASVNEEVVHGIPGDRVLQDGDIVSVDCGVRLRGYCGDGAATLPVGRVSPDVRRLLEATSSALSLAIAHMRPGAWWSEVAGVIQSHVEAAGFSVVREFVGHGIGQEMLEQRRSDFRLEPGLVIAVEPMVNMGSAKVRAGDATGWPQVTRDGRWSAHFEHTVAVTADGVDVLTDGR